MKERRRAQRKLSPLSFEYLNDNENVIAYCTNPTCRKIIFKGNDRSLIGNKILRMTVIEHIAAFESHHDIHIVHPRRRGGGRLVTGVDLMTEMVFSQEIIRSQLPQPPTQ